MFNIVSGVDFRREKLYRNIFFSFCGLRKERKYRKNPQNFRVILYCCTVAIRQVPGAQPYYGLYRCVPWDGGAVFKVPSFLPCWHCFIGVIRRLWQLKFPRPAKQKLYLKFTGAPLSPRTSLSLWTYCGELAQGRDENVVMQLSVCN